MGVHRTEAGHEMARGLDVAPPIDVLRRLAEGQIRAAQAVEAVLPALVDGARLIARTLKGSGRLIYVGAGSSGLMALADALELPGTYGIDPSRIAVLMAGGLADLRSLPGGPEDDADAGRRDALALSPASGDTVIAVSASGATPYVVAAAAACRAGGARVVAIANHAAAPLFAEADLRVALETPPELIAGSTRMGAATAQKIAFNMMSTLAAVMLGHVHDGHMVNLIADNRKLRARAMRMVSEISGIGTDDAELVLSRASGSVKVAVLRAAGVRSPEEARAALAASAQSLRLALDHVRRPAKAN